MKKILSLCVIAACVASPAFAQGYIGLGLGTSNSSGFGVAGFNGGSASKGLTKLYGGYQFTPNLGIEGQYADLGRRDIVTLANLPFGSYAPSQFSIAGTGTLPLTSGFSLLGKIGISANKVSGTVGIGNGSVTSPLVGLGIAYNLTSALSVRLEYEDFGKFANGNAGSSARLNGYSIGLKYAF